MFLHVFDPNGWKMFEYVSGSRSSTEWELRTPHILRFGTDPFLAPTPTSETEAGQESQQK